MTKEKEGFADKSGQEVHGSVDDAEFKVTETTALKSFKMRIWEVLVSKAKKESQHGRIGRKILTICGKEGV